MDSLMSLFNTRIAKLQDLVIAWNTLSLSLVQSGSSTSLSMNIDVIVCNFNVPDYKHNGFVNGGRKIEGDGACVMKPSLFLYYYLRDFLCLDSSFLYSKIRLYPYV